MATKKSTKTSAKRSTKTKRNKTAVKKKASPKKRAKSISSPASKKKATSKSAASKENSSKKIDAEVKLDRRHNADRRVEDLGESASNAIAPQLERRKKVQRRRQIDPTTCERDYSVEEVEFMSAMDDYKRKSGRMFPTCSEVLEVIRGIGYAKQTPVELTFSAETQNFENSIEHNDEASAELVGAGFSAPAMQESDSWSDNQIQ